MNENIEVYCHLKILELWIHFSRDSSSLAIATHPSYVLKSAWIAIQTPGPTVRDIAFQCTSFSQSISRRLNRFLLARTYIDFCTIHNESFSNHPPDTTSSTLPINYSQEKNYRDKDDFTLYTEKRLNIHGDFHQCSDYVNQRGWSALKYHNRRARTDGF